MFIAKNIKYLRDKEWLSQSKFAELFQLNRGNIASYEAGSEPTLSVIISIANYFNISIVSIETAKKKSIQKKNIQLIFLQ